MGMVFCAQCGADNKDGARYCSKCGATLGSPRDAGWEERVETWGEQFGARMERWGEDVGHRMENDCFGLPHGGMIAGIVFGLIVILVGLSLLWSWTLDIGGVIAIIIGTLIAVGAFYSILRKRT
jgi:uncharacterized membrane protein YvbJ